MVNVRRSSSVVGVNVRRSSSVVGESNFIRHDKHKLSDRCSDKGSQQGSPITTQQSSSINLDGRQHDGYQVEGMRERQHDGYQVEGMRERQQVDRRTPSAPPHSPRRQDLSNHSGLSHAAAHDRRGDGRSPQSAPHRDSSREYDRRDSRLRGEEIQEEVYRERMRRPSHDSTERGDDGGRSSSDKVLYKQHEHAHYMHEVRRSPEEPIERETHEKVDTRITQEDVHDEKKRRGSLPREESSASTETHKTREYLSYKKGESGSSMEYTEQHREQQYRPISASTRPDGTRLRLPLSGVGNTGDIDDVDVVSKSHQQPCRNVGATMQDITGNHRKGAGALQGGYTGSRYCGPSPLPECISAEPMTDLVPPDISEDVKDVERAPLKPTKRAPYIDAALEMLNNWNRPDLAFEVLFRFGTESTLAELVTATDPHAHCAELPSQHRVYLLHLLAVSLCNQFEVLNARRAQTQQPRTCSMARQVALQAVPCDDLRLLAEGTLAKSMEWIRELSICGAFDPLPEKDKIALHQIVDSVTALPFLLG
eukprot:GHVR01042129.1.p1 GENE.GHVR01042129.1~~GHVR01042129.1.p1  ORF type:complete len:537 (-),score=98.51 GHVR01042129.1:158-1768(-)